MLFRSQLGDTLGALQARVMSSANPSEIIEQLIEKTGYRDYVLDDTPQAEEREANLGVLAADAQAFATLPDFLEEVALMSTADQTCSILSKPMPPRLCGGMNSQAHWSRR